jgi:hypothetical protein
VESRRKRRWRRDFGKEKKDARDWRVKKGDFSKC